MFDYPAALSPAARVPRHNRVLMDRLWSERQQLLGPERDRQRRFYHTTAHRSDQSEPEESRPASPIGRDRPSLVSIS